MLNPIKKTLVPILAELYHQNMRSFLIAGIALVCFTLPVSAQGIGGTTALKAREAAGKVIAPEYRQNIIAMRGLRTSVAREPVEWLVWFYDHTAMQAGKRVRLAGTTVVEIKEGYTELERVRLAAYKTDEIIDPQTFKIDSDEALSRIKATGSLGSARITSAEFELRKDKTLNEPVWKVTAFGEVAGVEKEIARARLSAMSGRILNLSVTQ